MYLRSIHPRYRDKKTFTGKTVTVIHIKCTVKVFRMKISTAYVTITKDYKSINF